MTDDTRLDTMETQIQQILDVLTASQTLEQLQIWLGAQNIAPPVVHDPEPTNIPEASP